MTRDLANSNSAKGHSNSKNDSENSGEFDVQDSAESGEDSSDIDIRYKAKIDANLEKNRINLDI